MEKIVYSVKKGKNIVIFFPFFDAQIYGVKK